MQQKPTLQLNHQHMYAKEREKRRPFVEKTRPFAFCSVQPLLENEEQQVTPIVRLQENSKRSEE